MDMHELSFKTGVKNIDVWRELDRLAGSATGDGCVTNDASLAQERVRGGAQGAVPLVPMQK